MKILVPNLGSSEFCPPFSMQRGKEERGDTDMQEQLRTETFAKDGKSGKLVASTGRDQK